MGVGVGLRILRVDGRLDDAVLYCHSETVTIGGTTYRQLKKDTPADGAGETLSISTGALGYYVFGKFVFPLTGVYKILASTIYGVYRAYTNSTRPRVYPCISIYILKSDGTVRTTIATHVSQTSAYLTTSWATYTGASYSFSEYAVVDQTDYLEIDFEGYVGAALTGYYAYLRIDDSTLSTSDQTRTYDWNIAYPTYYTVNVSDSGKGADAVRNAVVKRLADSGKGVDALLKYSRFYRSFVDSGRSVEVFSKRSVFYRSFSDSGRSVDLASKYDFKRLGDSGRVYDYMCKFAIKRIAESSKVNEVVNKLGFKRLTDSGKAVDVLKKVAVKRLAESVRGVEVTWKVGLKVLAEACVTRERMYKSIQRILRDVAFGDFGFGYAKGKLVMVSDVARAYDSISKYSVFYRSFSDSGKGVDVLKKVAVKRVADAGKGADVLTKAVGKRLADSVKGADVVSKTSVFHVSFVDVGECVDMLSKVGFKMLVDSFKGTDVIVKGVAKSVVDSGKGVDRVSKIGVKRLADSFKGADVLKKVAVKRLAESVRGVEVTWKVGLKVLAEACVARERMYKSIQRILRDVVFGDFGFGYAKGKLVTVSDVARAYDSIVKRSVFYRSLSDSGRSVDVLKKVAVKRLADSGKGADVLTKAVGKRLADSVKGADAVSKVGLKMLMDSFKGTDAMIKGAIKRVVDSSIVGDYMCKNLVKVLHDVNFADFGFAKYYGALRIVSDSVKASDTIAKAGVKNVVEYAKAVELVSKRSVFYRSVVDVGKLVDVIATPKSIVITLRDVAFSDFGILKGIRFTKVDASKVSDTIIKYMVKSATDSSIVYDYMCKILSKKLCDATFADFSISKGITYVRGDAGKASDVISKVMIKNVADSSVMLDALAKSSMFHRSVADAVEGLDYVRTTSAFCRSLRDAVFGDFSSTKVMGKQVYDSSVVSDVILKSVKKVLVEFVIARDAPYRTIILNLRDRFSADFYVGKGYGFSVRDSAVAVDVITKVKYTLFGETVRRVYFHKVWGDIIEPSDYNLRIVVSNAFIQALKNVKDKLGV